MNRITKFSAILFATIVAALSLVACGPEDNDNENESGVGGGSQDVEENFDDIVGERVMDADAWQAAFDFSDLTNATYKYFIANDYIENNATKTGSIIIFYKFDDVKVYKQLTMWGDDDLDYPNQEIYYDFENSLEYTYNEESDLWEGRQSSKTSLTLASAIKSSEFGQNEVWSIGNYSDYAYDDENHAYVGCNGNLEYTIKIVNGKLRTLIATYTNYSTYSTLVKQTVVVNLWLDDKTSVTLPQNKIIL